MALTQVQSGILADSTQTYGMKNRIINGDMRIDQRNAGATVALQTGYVNYLDRWQHRYTSAAGSPTVGQSSVAPVGFNNSLLVTNGTAGTVSAASNNSVIYIVEGYNMADLQWGTANAKTVTLSFWVRCSVTGTFGGSFENYANNRSYPFTYTISSANTFEYKTITVSGDTSGTWEKTNSGALIIWWDLGIGSNYQGTAGAWAGSDYRTATGSTQFVTNAGATFYITGVQLEKGSTATQFDYRPYGTELQLCQRYYHYLGGDTAYQSINTCVWYGSGEAVGFFRHPVEMRVAPTIAKTGSWGTLGSGGTVAQTVNADQNGPKTTQLGFSGGSGGTSGQGTTLRGNNDLTLRVTFSAEL
jgi:hypothetical protein